MKQTTEIVPNMTLSEAIALYNSATEQIVMAFASIVDAQQKLSLFGEYIEVSAVNGGRCPHFEHPADTLAGIEKRVWGAIVNRMGIRQVMGIAARDKLDKQLEKGDMPPLTEETVLGMLMGMHASLPKLAEEAIREVWEWLRPPEHHHMAKGYKTNPRFELGKCVKVPGVLDSWYIKQCRFHVDHYYDARLDSLERVFRVLEGKGAAQRGYRSDLGQAINATPFGSGAQCETEYFSVRLYLKGAIHLTFKRPDLVAQFNRICGGMNLRGERAGGLDRTG